jgi:hypothetical protein
MQQYLLSIYQPDGDAPPPEILEPIMRDLEAVNAEIRAAGAWVFSGGLYPPSTATEGKEHIGGFTVIQAPDLDAALEWGGKLARAITLPIEVRPLQYGTCG